MTACQEWPWNAHKKGVWLIYFSIKEMPVYTVSWWPNIARAYSFDYLPHNGSKFEIIILFLETRYHTHYYNWEDVSSNLMHSPVLKIKGNSWTFGAHQRQITWGNTCTSNTFQRLATYPKWCGHAENGRADLWASHTRAKENRHSDKQVHHFPITTKFTKYDCSGTWVISFSLSQIHLMFF